MLGILALGFGLMTPALDRWDARETLRQQSSLIWQNLTATRQEALKREVTTRLTLVDSSGDLSLQQWVSDSNPSLCDASGSWTLARTTALEIPAAFTLTGPASSHVCFFRDGSASGETYVMAETGGTQVIGRAEITIFAATGHVDYVMEGAE